MRNEKLEQAATRYIEAANSLKDAEYKANQARSLLEAARGVLAEARKGLKDFVGQNIPHRAASIPGHMITIEYSGETYSPTVRVFDTDGNEIRL